MKRFGLCITIVLILACGMQSLVAQSLTTGDLTGAITDQSGGILSGVKVNLKNNGTGGTQTTVTNREGVYRFPFLTPGSYTISLKPNGFQAVYKRAQIAVGQAAVVDFNLQLAATTTTIQVTEAADTVQSDNADITTHISSEQIANLPNPGNDLTFYAQVSPGVEMSTNAGFGYGNFSSFGLPGTSNTFTVNGAVNNDTFLNLNQSGASNLTLGSNAIAEATVVNNGYSGQYGGLAGAQMNLISKSGANQFHGNAVYYWNGRAMNANNFFNDSTGTPKPFSNVNYWATGIGGPLQKNKTFFFFDYEGLRIVLPTNTNALIPSQPFATATLNNLAANGNAAEIPFYRNIFKLYSSAPGASSATPVPGGGCADFTGLAVNIPCALQFRSVAGNNTQEYLWNARVDHNFSDRDRAYVSVQRDLGVQPTWTDSISPLFDAFSRQPEMNGQISENHTFGVSAVNQFILAGQFYSAKFSDSNESSALAAFPTTLFFGGGQFTTLGGLDFEFPSGRNATQYQVIDDFSKSAGNHTFKFGMNFHRVDLTDFDLLQYTTGLIVENTLTDFANGGGLSNELSEKFPNTPEVPLAYYNLGFYGQDEWRATHSLKVTATLRIDHNSNPVCQVNCFANLTSSFTALNHNSNIPYNQAIQIGLHQALPSTDPIIWEPRLGFTWTPAKGGNTVLRGGIGIFGDTFPGATAEYSALNTPEVNGFTVSNVSIAPGVPNSGFTIASQANQSLINGFKSGGTLASISAANPLFSPPNYTAFDGKYRQARYQEWNLEIQQALPEKMALSVNYVGNHGIHELIQNGGVNGYSPGFAGLPAAAPDPRFATVTQFDTGGVSNYNGMVVSLRRAFSAGWQFQVNYTYGHALDDVSNGGISPFTYVNAATPSILYPEDPYNIRKYNYGNSDYDVRHYFSANYVWDDSFRHLFRRGPNMLFSGWSVSGTIFARSGLPFTVVDGAATGTLSGANFNFSSSPFEGDYFAIPIKPGYTACGASAVNTPCLSASQFLPANPNPTGFGPQTRNNYRGPDYFDTDLAVMKNFRIPRWESAKLAMGVQFFNLFNHPNFDRPVNDVSAGLFGTIQSLVSAPTSILGSFAGADAAPRIIQVKGTFTF